MTVVVGSACGGLGARACLPCRMKFFKFCIVDILAVCYEVVQDVRLQAVEGAQVVPPEAQGQAGTIADKTGMMIEPGGWNVKERGEFQILVAAVGLDRLRKNWKTWIAWCRGCHLLRSTDDTS